MPKFKTVFSNEVVSIMKDENSNVCFVSNSVLLKSDISHVEKHLSLLEEALSRFSVPKLGETYARKIGNDIFGYVEGIPEIKFSYRLGTNGWHVANSSAIPQKLGEAKAYLEALQKAYELLKSQNKKSSHSVQQETHKSEIIEYGDQEELIIEGKIDGQVVYQAKRHLFNWTFKVIGNVKQEVSWMNELASLIAKVNTRVSF